MSTFFKWRGGRPVLEGGCIKIGIDLKAGFDYGVRGDMTYLVVEDRMHIHNFHVTVLYMLGLDRERLIYRYRERDLDV